MWLQKRDKIEQIFCIYGTKPKNFNAGHPNFNDVSTGTIFAIIDYSVATL